MRPEAMLKIVIVGHVDHGKSTLIGRLLHDTGALPEGKREAIEAVCARRGMPFEWAFLMDSIQAERDQGITIDTSQIRFATEKRGYVVIDAPGHVEFLKNMVTGAAAAEAALLLIDAEDGLKEQSRRHGYLLSLLGVRQVTVLVNKMDLVGYDAERFGAVAESCRAYLRSIGVEPAGFVPMSAREGDNVARRSTRMHWYQGPTVLEALDRFESRPGLADRPLRMPVQGVYKFDARRIVAGRIEAGTLRVGDEVMFSPSNKTARVASIEAWSVPETPVVARAGQSIGVIIEPPIFVERGEIMSHVGDAPIETSVFRGRLFWLADAPLLPGNVYTLKHGTLECPCTVERIERVVDTDALAGGSDGAIRRNQVGDVILRARRLLAVDEHDTSPATGRFVLVENHLPVAGGQVSMEGYPDQRALITVRATNVTAVGHAVSTAARAARNGHEGAVLWFTGLSGAGKSTLALALEAELFARGYQVYVLDGDNVRTGLNANLGFSPEDRAENIRRVGEVAALFADAGFVVISSFISPYRADRERARAAAGDRFHEIHVEASLEVCEARDPKGLYRKARAGEITDFTGIQSPYEPPESPDLVVDTAHCSVEEGLDRLVGYVQTRLG